MDKHSEIERALLDLSSWLKSSRCLGIIIGGVAASLLGRPRLTQDVDALVKIEEGRWGDFVEQGKSFGFVPRITNPISFAQRSRVILLKHQPTGIPVDLSLASLAFEMEALKRAIFVRLGKSKIPVPTPEDLVIMKMIAHRPRDMADIEGVLDAQVTLDLRRIRRWVRLISKAIDTPGLIGELEKLLKARRKRN